MAFKEVKTIFSFEDGSERATDRRLLFCHNPGCGYATDRDSRIKLHRTRMHKNFCDSLNVLGLFWGSLKSWINDANRFPSIGEFLGQGEMWSCKICDFISSSSLNVRDHISSVHRDLSTRDKENSMVPIFLKYSFGESLTDEIRPLSSASVNDDSNILVSNSSPENSQPSNEVDSIQTIQSPHANIDDFNQYHNDNHSFFDSDNQLMQPLIVDLSYISETPSILPENSTDLHEINEVFNIETLSNCKANDEIFSNYLSLAFESEDDQLKDLLANLQEAPRPTMSSDKDSEISIEVCISTILRTAPARCWPPFTNDDCCFICNEAFESNTSFLMHVHNMHPNLVYFVSDQLLCCLRYLTDTPIECILVNADGSSEVFKRSNCICRVPGCTFIADTYEDLLSHMARRKDRNHFLYKVMCNKYGPFYGSIKAFVSICNRLPCLFELLKGSEVNNYRCKKCGKILTSSVKAVESHFSKSHRNLCNNSLIDKIASVRISFSTAPLLSNSLEDASVKKNRIKHLVDDLRKNITLDEGTKLIDDACSRILYDNHDNSDVPATSFHSYNIVPSKIVSNKNSSQHPTISTPINSNIISVLSDSEEDVSIKDDHQDSFPKNAELTQSDGSNSDFSHNVDNVLNPDVHHSSQFSLSASEVSNIDVLSNDISDFTTSSKTNACEVCVVNSEEHSEGELSLALQFPEVNLNGNCYNSPKLHSSLNHPSSCIRHSQSNISCSNWNLHPSLFDSASNRFGLTDPFPSAPMQNLQNQHQCNSLQNSFFNSQSQSSESFSTLNAYNSDSPSSNVLHSSSNAPDIPPVISPDFNVVNPPSNNSSLLNQPTPNILSRWGSRSSRNGGTCRNKRANINDDSRYPLNISLDVPDSTSVTDNIESSQRHIISQGLKWYNESLNRKFVHLPKLDREKRKLVSNGLKELFEGELIPLLSYYDPDKFENLDQDVAWKLFEGAFEESIHRIRLHIATKLNIDVDRIYSNKMKKRWSNKIQEELADIQMNSRYLNKLASDIEKLNSIDKLNEEVEFEKAQRRILKYLSFISNDDRTRIFGTNDSLTILDELSYQGNKARECGEWLQTTIGELIKKEMSLKASQRQSNKIRECYSENPRKTLNNFILNKVQPQCLIDESSLHDFFARTFRKNDEEFIPDDDGIFAISNCFDDHDKELFMNLITNEESFKEVISSRKYDSAAGPDGIDYSVFKLLPNISAKFFCLISKVIVKKGRVPHGWKKSIMRLLYKKGDINCPSNWRPISISNSIYRIFSCVWAKSINKAHLNLHIFSNVQRGFIEAVNGCSDNAMIISELFYDAMRNHRNIFVTALDFKNAFGSVSHDMIIDCLKKKGFPSEFIHIIKNVYTGSTTSIITNNFVSEEIDIKKGTKQGCPVSPLLFNLCLEPLFNAISSVNRDHGYWVNSSRGEARFNILAYADDILLISETEVGMSNMLRTCELFCRYSKMELAPSKSCSFAYILRDNLRCGLTRSFMVNNEPIPYVGLDESVRYLGVPVAVRKLTKLKSSSDYLMKFTEKALKVFNSDLLITQKVHAIKTFLIPSLDFVLSNGQMKIKHIDKLDSFISASINKLVGGNVPLSVKHGSWKDGGLSVPSLREKCETCRVKSLLRLITHKDCEIRSLAFSAIEGEKHKRNVCTEPNPNLQSFLDWKDDSLNNEHSGTNSIVQRARVSFKNLDLTIKEIGCDELNDSDTEDNDTSATISNSHSMFELKDLVLNKSIKFDKSKNLSLFLTSRRRERWKERMHKNTFHLHGLYSFSENPLSNFYLMRQFNPVCNTLFKFAIKCRTNLLGTPEVNELYNNLPHAHCSACLNHGRSSIQSLKHILNGCVTKFKLYTERHNRLQSILLDYVRKLPGVEEIFCDHTIHFTDLPDDLRLLRPDIVAWHDQRKKCSILEISVPYSHNRWGEDSLKAVYEHKKEKYQRLVEFLRNNGINVQFYTIVVSSFGAVFKDSIADINRLIPTRSIGKNLIKRLSVNALWGSLKIWNLFSKEPLPEHISSDPDDEDTRIDEVPTNDDDDDNNSFNVTSLDDGDFDSNELQFNDDHTLNVPNVISANPP